MIRKAVNRAMTTVKKGHLALAQEWRKHLRDLKRLYWKRERRAGVTESAHQVSEAPHEINLYDAIRRRVADAGGGFELPEIKRGPIRPPPSFD